MVEQIAAEIKIAEKDIEVITPKKETKDKEEMHDIETLTVDVLESLTYSLNDDYCESQQEHQKQIRKLRVDIAITNKKRKEIEDLLENRCDRVEKALRGWKA